MTLFDDPAVLPARTLLQPFAGLVELGLKDIETVATRTSYRGPLVICAGHRVDVEALRKIRRALVPRRVSPEAFDEATARAGVAVAVATIATCRRLERHDRSRAFWWSASEPRWAWLLEDLCRLRPFKVRGMPGFFPLSRSSVEAARILR